MKFLLCLLVAALLCSTGHAADKETRFFELRTYTAAPGKLDALLARFRDHTVQLFEKHGMVNVGYWVPQENSEGKLIYLLAFPSREAHDKSWADFVADPEWKKAFAASEAEGKLTSKVESMYLSPTDYSPVVVPGKAASPRLFELRTYQAAPGKLNDLNTRFRDHTLALFSKHGMTNFGYWGPVDQKDGVGEKLVYLVVHKDKAASDVSWKEFRADADWNKAKAESEAKGPLTAEGGVKSVFLVPTDFSPTK